MHARAKSNDSVASKQIASAIWFLLKNIPQRKAREKVIVKDAETQESSPKNDSLYTTDNINNSSMQKLPWYTANYEWHTNTMIEQREHNPKNAEITDQQPQEMAMRISKSPSEDQIHETNSRSKGRMKPFLKLRGKKKEKKAKKGKGKRSKEDEGNIPSEASSKSTVSQMSTGSAASSKKSKKGRKKRKKDKESDESLSKKEKKPKETDKKQISAGMTGVDFQQTHAAHERQPPTDLSDFTKSCCYLCAQNTAAITAAINAKPPAIEKDAQVSVEAISKPVETSDKSLGPAPQVRTVQSSVRVRTRDASTFCPEPCAKRRVKARSKSKKFKLSKFFPGLKRKKCPARRTIACETDEFVVQCGNSAKCKWTNECRRGNNV